MMLQKIASDKPVVTILTILAASVAIIAGGVVTITNPQNLSFHQYVQDIAFMAGALGLGSGIGRGIDSYGQAIASSNQPGGKMETAPVSEPEPAPPEPAPEPTPAPEPPTEPTPEEPGDTANPYDTEGPPDHG